ncbi:NTP transferase domain-containing protein [Candidatus Aerophobetes bacterium]|nr:NTP transferase domain-containing protein [Candidatus Aerophobetes bacterium]
MKDTVAVILAAGESKRMNSNVSKLLHHLGGKLLVEFPVQACIEANVGRIIVVVGHQADKLKETLKDKGCEFVYQEKRLGTGDALRRATPLLQGFNGELVVLPGDAPFISASLLKKLVIYHRKRKSTATILTSIVPEPGYYGRVVRNGYKLVKKIVESKNATPHQLKIKEINSGIYCFDAGKIILALPSLKVNRLSGEVYLTDIFEIFYRQKEKVEALPVDEPYLCMGVNTPDDWKKACEFFRNSGLFLSV